MLLMLIKKKKKKFFFFFVVFFFFFFFFWKKKKKKSGENRGLALPHLAAKHLSCNRFRAPASFRLSHIKYIFEQFYGSATCLPAIMQPFPSASERQIKSLNNYPNSSRRQEFEVGKRIVPNTHPNAVCLSVPTYSAHPAKMAGRIWLKIGRGTQDGWQSVLKQKNC